jgi:hypothetical protein
VGSMEIMLKPIETTYSTTKLKILSPTTIVGERRIIYLKLIGRK